MDFSLPSVNQCGIHYQGVVVLYKFVIKITVKSVEVFYYTNDLGSCMEMSTLTSESSRLFWWTKESFFLPVVVGSHFVFVIGMNRSY